MLNICSVSLAPCLSATSQGDCLDCPQNHEERRCQGRVKGGHSRGQKQFLSTVQGRSPSGRSRTLKMHPGEQHIPGVCLSFPQCYGLNCVPHQNSRVEVLNPIPQSVTVFEYRAFKKAIKLKRKPLGCALIQSNWYLMRRRDQGTEKNTRGTRTQSKDHERTQPEGGYLHAKERGLRRNCAC